jgi:hypothetical protein
MNDGNRGEQQGKQAEVFSVHLDFFWNTKPRAKNWRKIVGGVFFGKMRDYLCDVARVAGVDRSHAAGDGA